ncbi:MAG: HNH endonuclease [Chloroflexi bacterium]|nr:MAG: HNH endonuclease [Chloroflexota bacterium]
MSVRYISPTLRQKVAEFANYRCCYCQTSQRIIGPLLEIDHIIPEARGGSSQEDNLAIACPMCNSHKSDRIDAIDLDSQTVVRLFHPRRDRWNEHFEWAENGAVIRGKTPVGRATVLALQMNHPDVVSVRQMWVTVGWHPPAD